ncbi:HMG-Y-related protein A-like [Musa acuminata AAA Group]|uniref:HMG-Y-related protein A-like n=1 Tax=Musa acuminata AAA Group TaxID=214697 RepID=UPI0031D92B39
MNFGGAPKRHTPTHPPYAVMIAAAIRCLAEEGGSSEAAISEYIRANYDDIPWAHDRLLPYYLNKLTEQGEFVVGSPGRYMTAYDDGPPGDAPRTSKPAPAPEPCSAGCSLEPVAADEARRHAADAGGDGFPVRRRRGRPPKRRRRDGPGSQHGPEDCGGEGGSVVRRRRGRQPRKRIEADVSQDDGNNCGDAGSSDLAEAPPSLQPTHAEALPPEPNIVVDGTETVLALPCAGPSRADDDEDPPSMAPSTVAEDEAEAIRLPNEETGNHGSSVAKRRRGRPSKRKPSVR